MLLREFDQGEEFISDLENMLQVSLNKYDNEDSVAKISYEALSQLLQRSGSYGSVNRNIIDQAVEKSPALRQLIRNYDGDSVTLNTEKEAPKDTLQPQPDLEKTDQGISKTTQQAASSAASAGLTN
jgi:hypothetical protein